MTLDLRQVAREILATVPLDVLAIHGMKATAATGAESERFAEGWEPAVLQMAQAAGWDAQALRTQAGLWDDDERDEEEEPEHSLMIDAALAIEHSKRAARWGDG